MVRRADDQRARQHHAQAMPTSLTSHTAEHLSGPFRGPNEPVETERALPAYTAAQRTLVLMALYHVMMIGAAVALSIYKPGGRLRRPAPHRARRAHQVDLPRGGAAPRRRSGRDTL